MAGNFLHQTAIVTGAGQGIGFEICHQLAAGGAFVVLNDKDAALAERALQDLEAMGGKGVVVAGDAGSMDVIGQMVAAAMAFSGRLDLVVANAGITLFGDFFSYTPDAFQQVVQTNLAGSFFLAQAAANCMRRAREEAPRSNHPYQGGSFLFMSSVTGHQAHQNLAAYGMTKAALEMLARHLVIELSPLGINVNAIAPGATLTERTAGDPDYLSTWSRITPMGRPATTEDIAAAACFLLSAEARHITGQTLVIDGGWTAMSPSPY